MINDEFRLTGKKTSYQRNDETLRQFQEISPQNCILGCGGTLLLNSLNKNKKKQTFRNI